MKPLYEHQKQTVALLEQQPRVFDASDPGTGKTRGALEAFAARRRKGGGKALVLAPKTILQSAWGDQIDEYLPGITYMCAHASNRKAAFDMDVDIYLTNHDAVKWCLANKKQWDGFDTLIVDESTAYKHASSQRSRALRTLSKFFAFREALTGTPNPNSVLELWHQILILDDGERLGSSYYRFRDAVCNPVRTGPGPNHIEWRDKEGAEEIVFDLIRDITIRHKFEDCVSIPPNHNYSVWFDLPPRLRAQYEEMVNQTSMMLDDGKELTAVHAASLSNKLLQIASGAVYTGDEKEYRILDNTRNELVMDLIEQRTHSVTAFMWRHQREQLEAAAKARQITYGVIDGSTSRLNHNRYIEEFQAGKLKTLFIHPASAAHGLTLTKGVATIIVSPTYNAEHYKQIMHRIYRTGQTQATETINVLARGTIDERVHDSLERRLSSMQLLLELMEAA